MERILVLVVLVALASVGVQAFPVNDYYELNPHIQVKKQASDLTCWTCRNKTNNTECNDWAPDVTCPLNHTVCKTVHRIDTSSSVTLVVNKMCAPAHHCTEDHVGCHDTDIQGVKECVSCCASSYCNEGVPTDIGTAWMLTSLTNSGSDVTCCAVLIWCLSSLLVNILSWYNLAS